MASYAARSRGHTASPRRARCRGSRPAVKSAPARSRRGARRSTHVQGRHALHASLDDVAINEQWRCSRPVGQDNRMPRRTGRESLDEGRERGHARCHRRTAPRPPAAVDRRTRRTAASPRPARPSASSRSMRVVKAPLTAYVMVRRVALRGGARDRERPATPARIRPVVRIDREVQELPGLNRGTAMRRSSSTV